jgi:hypothetical protein
MGQDPYAVAHEERIEVERQQFLDALLRLNGSATINAATTMRPVWH